MDKVHKPWEEDPASPTKFPFMISARPTEFQSAVARSWTTRAFCLRIDRPYSETRLGASTLSREALEQTSMGHNILHGSVSINVALILENIGQSMGV